MRKKFKKLHFKFVRFRKVRLPRRIQKFKLMSRHPFAVPIVTLLVLITLTAGIFFVARQTNNLPADKDVKVVIISHDHVQQTVPSNKTTVGKLLKKLEIPVNEGDVIEPGLSTVINQSQFRINVYRAVPVEVVDGTNSTFTYSAAKTPRSVAEQAGTAVQPEDQVIAKPTQDFLKSGTIGAQVIVNRAMTISLNLYGTPLVIRSHATTVGELLKQKGIKLAADDQVIPAKDTALTPNAQVVVTRKGVKIETVTETLPMPVQTINDPTLAYGTSAIRQQGSPGQQVTTYQNELSNGVVVGKKVLQQVITQAPVTQIVVQGTNLSGIKGDMARAGISPGDYNYVDYIFEHESRWNPAAVNGGGCTGLGQACPGSKLINACPNWRNDPICQIRFFNGYAVGRYGSWGAAYQTKVRQGWW